jgi:adenylyltransferase/sulfurtransferase
MQMQRSLARKTEARDDGAMDFSETQIRRYARHILLPEVGGEGQSRLIASRVLVVGAGGLGSPLLLYLAAAGVGTLGVIDDDRVELSNLQRQVIHATADLGRPKAQSAAARIAEVNPEVAVEAHETRLAANNALDLVSAYDIVADGSDNFATRFLLADACHLARRPLVSAALLRFEAQLTTAKAFAGGGLPCYRCIFPAPPAAALAPACAEAGVFGALAGLAGSLQAVEVLKELLGIGEGLAGRLLLVDALSAEFRKLTVRRDPGCRLCGDAPAIADLTEHERAEAR